MRIMELLMSLYVLEFQWRRKMYKFEINFNNGCL